MAYCNILKYPIGRFSPLRGNHRLTTEVEEMIRVRYGEYGWVRWRTNGFVRFHLVSFHFISGVEHPDKRWPKHFWDCDLRLNEKRPESSVTEGYDPTDEDRPVFYCSDAEFCNWTNNPVMFGTFLEIPEWYLKSVIHSYRDRLLQRWCGGFANTLTIDLSGRCEGMTPSTIWKGT